MKNCHWRHSSQWTPWRRSMIIAMVAAMGWSGFVLVGCSSRPKPAEGDYTGQARYAYEEAMDAFESSDFLESLKRFNFVRTKFTYSKFAALASLRIGDVYFEQDKMPEAIESYRRFVQLHPTHPDVPYARYRTGLAYYEQLPGDWFFMPPAYEKDLASTEDAEKELKRFMDLHPNSQYAEEVAEKLRTVRQRLADHEFYVAMFYMKRDEPRSAAMRFKLLVERFPGLGFDEESLYLLGKSYVQLHDVAKAVEVWGSLIEQFPNHALAVKADQYIQAHGLNEAVVLRRAQEKTENNTLQEEIEALPEPNLPSKLEAPTLGKP